MSFTRERVLIVTQSSKANQCRIKEQTVAVLGAGQMGSMLVSSLLRDLGLKPEKLRATTRHAEHAKELSAQLGVEVTTDNRAATRGADIVFICVKPRVVPELLEEIRSELSPTAAVISIATAVTTNAIEQILGSQPVVRAMPNTACKIGAGMTALVRGQYANHVVMDAAQQVFDAMGRTVVIDEYLMDAVTGLAASGPAFVYIMLESLAEGGVRMGLPRNVSTLLAAQAMLGAASMVLTTGEHPAVLKEQVTTPGGCTIDGILDLEDGGIRATLIRAISTAATKARMMAPPQVSEEMPASRANSVSRRSTSAK